MQQDAYRILSRNLRDIAPRQAAYEALAEGIYTELASLFQRGDDPAALFCSISETPLCSMEFARFCRLCLHGVTDPTALRPFLGEQAAEEDPRDTRTAYLRSVYTDRAFAVFAGGIERLSAQYQPSFSAGCEEVYYGRCSYCILPIRSSGDGILTSFLRTIAKYDLKITRVCDVVTSDGDATTRYALLRRGLDLRVPEAGILETTVVLPDGVSLAEFLSAAEATGARAEEMTTIPLPYTDERTSLHLCFHIDSESAAPLLAFLHAVLDSHTPDGMYSVAE